MISIDPGTKALGVAEWTLGELTGARLIRTRGRTLDAMCKGLPLPADVPDSVAYVELMEHHPRRKGSMPNDLIRVATVGGVLAARLAFETRFVSAKTWKGNTPKAIHHERIWRRLSDDEREVLQKALDATPQTSHHKEILDAVGIGLWATGRRA